MEILNNASKLIKSKKIGKEWVEEVLPVIVDVAREIKTLEGRRDSEAEPFKNQVKEIGNKYKPALEPLGEISSQLRGRIMIEHEGNETVAQEGIGKLVFPETWNYEVADFARVPKEYTMEVVDNKKVMEEIKNGVRKIRGLEIRKTRSLRVITNSD